MSIVPASWRIAATAILLSQIALLCVAAGCTSPRPETAPKLELVTLEAADGDIHTVKVEVARTSNELWTGLRYRKSMPADQGMLFDLGQVRWADFTMRDTLIPLDMLFLSESGQIVTIHARTTPGEPGPYSSSEPVRAVLELNGGATEAYGIKLGDTVRAGLFGNAPAAAN